MGKHLQNYFRCAIIIAALGIIVFTLCTDGEALAKIFVVFGMSLLIISMIISFERGSVDSSSKQVLSLPDKFQLLTQVLILTALVFVIMDFPYKWVVITVLALAFISSAMLFYKWKK